MFYIPICLLGSVVAFALLIVLLHVFQFWEQFNLVSRETICYCLVCFSIIIHIKKHVRMLKVIKILIKQDKRMGCNTRTSQEVTHPSTTLAQTRLTA